MIAATEQWKATATPTGQEVFSEPFERRPPSGESAPHPTDMTRQTHAVLVVHVQGDTTLEPDGMFKVIWPGGEGIRAAVSATILIQNDDFQLGLPELLGA